MNQPQTPLSLTPRLTMSNSSPRPAYQLFSSRRTNLSQAKSSASLHNTLLTGFPPEIRELDSERQALVYNHHHELIAASDTIAAVCQPPLVIVRIVIPNHRSRTEQKAWMPILTFSKQLSRRYLASQKRSLWSIELPHESIIVIPTIINSSSTIPIYSLPA